MVNFYGLANGNYEKLERIPGYVLDAITAIDDYLEGTDCHFQTGFGHGGWQVEIYKSGVTGPLVGMWFMPEAE